MIIVLARTFPGYRSRTLGNRPKRPPFLLVLSYKLKLRSGSKALVLL
jgi:hypothetical protein